MATATQSLTVLSQFADWPHGREGSLTVGPNKASKIDAKSPRGKCGGPQKGDGRSGQQDWSEGVRVAKVSFLSIWGDPSSNGTSISWLLRVGHDINNWKCSVMKRPGHLIDDFR